MPSSSRLARTIPLPLLLFYGLGNILGAGIYVLVGEVAGVAGMYVPLSFFIALVIATFTALTYSELVARFPVAAGAAAYIKEGLGSQHLSVAAGVVIAVAGLVSAATIARGFAGYIGELINIHDIISIVFILFLLGAIASWGISQSVKFATVLTLIEIGGLLLLIWVGAPAYAELPDRLPELIPPMELDVWEQIIVASFIAFYAFLGFEDMVNIAEEVKDPARSFRLAIFGSLFIATILYIAIALVGVLLVEPQKLSDAEAPFAEIYRAATGHGTVIITLIGIFAIINGALIQIIMASRIFYGMSDKGWFPAFLSYVHPKTRTPIIATVCATLISLGFALWLPLVSLANLTSTLVLIVFTLVNLALLRVKWHDPSPKGVKTVPMWVPAVGILLNILFLGIQFFAVWKGE